MTLTPSPKPLETLEGFYTEIRTLFENHGLDPWVQVEVLNRFPANGSPGVRFLSIQRFLETPGNVASLYRSRLQKEFPDVLTVEAVTLNQIAVSLESLEAGKSPKVIDGIREVRTLVEGRLERVRQRIRDQDRESRTVRR